MISSISTIKLTLTLILTLFVGAAASLATGCIGLPKREHSSWVGLWAGTYVETATERSSGAVTTTAPAATNLRIESDSDGLFTSSGSCELPLKSLSDSSLQALPTACDVSGGRLDVFSGQGYRTGANLRFDTHSTFTTTDGAIWDVDDAFDLTRTTN